MTLNPQAAHYTLMGIETLSLRMERHVENAERIAQWLEADPRIEYVTYAGLKSSPYYDRIENICPRGAGALFTFAVKGGYNSCVKLVESLELFRPRGQSWRRPVANHSLGVYNSPSADPGTTGCLWRCP